MLSAASKTSERAWVFFMGIYVEKWMGSLYDSQPAITFPRPVGQDHVDMERLHFGDAAQAQDSGLVMCRFFGDAFV